MADKEFHFNCAQQTAASWRDRAEKCCDMLDRILPDLARPFVLSDIGCGDLKLRKCLTDRGMDVIYRGYDLRPQKPEVQYLDLNSQVPEGSSDVTVLLGVTEYLNDLRGALTRLAGYSRFLIFSHVLKERTNSSKDHLDSLGWINHLTQDEVKDLIGLTGYSCVCSIGTENLRTMLWLCKSSNE